MMQTNHSASVTCTLIDSSLSSAARLAIWANYVLCTQCSQHFENLFRQCQVLIHIHRSARAPHAQYVYGQDDPRHEQVSLFNPKYRLSVAMWLPIDRFQHTIFLWCGVPVRLCKTSSTCAQDLAAFVHMMREVNARGESR